MPAASGDKRRWASLLRHRRILAPLTVVMAAAITAAALIATVPGHRREGEASQHTTTLSPPPAVDWSSTTLPPGPTSAVSSVAFSPDGHTLAAGTYEGLKLWDVTQPAHPKPIGNPNNSLHPLLSVAFSPNRHTLAAAVGPGPTGSDTYGSVWLWNISDPAHPTRLDTPTGADPLVTSVAFSPDGHTLAASAGGQVGGVWLWNVVNPTHPVQLKALPTSLPYSLAFSPDGRTLAVGCSDDTTRLWTAD
ncbi:WD40 repeat domain-containing protein [Pseudofrankia inefficax]|uniref:WD40 repeat domain-containing protein n=1 Tax=Pseudofrankia inefficax (strain DSM 45817 / CECT 9037 / DDB 130130 / EuI1c) TaxID=298654 RepID=UPI0018DFAB96|nr:hypothetical protein [Pseudofrankia inefficax]